VGVGIEPNAFACAMPNHERSHSVFVEDWKMSARLGAFAELNKKQAPSLYLNKIRAKIVIFKFNNFYNELDKD